MVVSLRALQVGCRVSKEHCGPGSSSMPGLLCPGAGELLADASPRLEAHAEADPCVEEAGAARQRES